MRYGVMNFPIKPVAGEIATAASLRFDFVELAMDPPEAHWLRLRHEGAAVTRALAKYGLGLVCHLPAFVSPADLNPAIRETSRLEMQCSLEVAAELGARKAVVHPAPILGLGSRRLDLVRAYAHQSLATLVEKAQALGMLLCLENMFPRYGWFYEPDEFRTLLEQMPTLGLTLDCGHAHIADPEGKRALEFIRRLGPRIAHVHLSDNRGRRDEHLAIGAGSIAWEPLVSELCRAGYDDTITLEVFDADRRRIERSREAIAAMVSGQQ
jgi:sugar phosphate isomerase/epimerase